MEFISQALLILPSIAFMFIVILILKNQTSIAKTSNSIVLKKERQQHFLPLRVDAYQRMILFMERISPNSLIMRTFQNEKPAKVFQTELLETIRQEYEHNVAQQLFISPKGWKLIRESKEEIVKIINLAASQVDENATSLDLSSKIFEITSQLKHIPTEVTNEILISELQGLF
jgi:hypothetical protein